MGQTYLVRFAESGRDGQPERQGVRRDLAQVLAAALPGARIAAESGRLLVDAGGDAASVLADLPGVASFSPCRRVALSEVAEAAIATAAEALPRGGSFCVRVKLVGTHPLRSRDLAIQVGAAIAARLPALSVDLRRPDAVIGIEVRGADCFVFHQVVPGVDRCGVTPVPDGEPRFLADQMLGRLAVWLRVLGYDTAQPLDQPDSLLLRLARDEGRVLLTQDAALSRSASAATYYVLARGFEEQLVEVVRRFRLAVDPARLLTRCTRCNRAVDQLAAEEVRAVVPPEVQGSHEVFFVCPACRRVYWRGDHCQRILDRLATLAL